MSVFGTRPEAIKMAPLVRMLGETAGIASSVCVTAQHRELLDQVLSIFKIVPEYDLDLMKERQTLTGITDGVLTGLENVLERERPDLVLVHGDTTTSFAAALAAFYRRIPVGHVEAGLRSFDRYSPYPEEMNRALTGRLAELHFAPTGRNAENLRAEGVTGGIHVTGNTVIDALYMMVRDDYYFKSTELADIFTDGEKRTILLTAHRRENIGEPFENIFEAVGEIAGRFPDVRVIYPVHPNPAVREPAKRILGGIPNVNLISPIDVQDMHNLIGRCHMVMTDSGGLQEEAPALGKPVLVLRTETERPEAIEAGTVKMAGIEKNRIVELAETLLDNRDEYERMATAVNPYGDGHASRRIVTAILDWGKKLI